MLDLTHIVNSQQDIKIYQNNGTWQTWTRPRKCQYAYIICIGGGAGGDGGTTVTNQAAFGGGSGALTRILLNANLIPDTLYIRVGEGGAGAISGGTPENGSKSYVSFLPNVTANNIVVTSGNVAAQPSIGESIAVLSNMVFSSLGSFISVAGYADNTLNNIDPFNNTLVTPGGAGGIFYTATLESFPGISINQTALSSLISGGEGAIGSGNAGHGADGITSWKPFFSLGGAGGGSAYAGIGGNGGNGGIGSGGGGGGGGSVAGGKGGDGGDGLVMIIAF
jgi:hypothetical protein